ncbi:MAG: hypothetical protein ACE5IK_02985 [Acidobacteriota bacterium]
MRTSRLVFSGLTLFLGSLGLALAGFVPAGDETTELSSGNPDGGTIRFAFSGIDTRVSRGWPQPVMSFHVSVDNRAGGVLTLRTLDVWLVTGSGTLLSDPQLRQDGVAVERIEVADGAATEGDLLFFLGPTGSFTRVNLHWGARIGDETRAGVVDYQAEGDGYEPPDVPATEGRGGAAPDPSIADESDEDGDIYIYNDGGYELYPYDGYGYAPYYGYPGFSFGVYYGYYPSYAYGYPYGYAYPYGFGGHHHHDGHLDGHHHDGVRHKEDVLRHRSGGGSAGVTGSRDRVVTRSHLPDRHRSSLPRLSGRTGISSRSHGSARTPSRRSGRTLTSHRSSTGHRSVSASRSGSSHRMSSRGSSGRTHRVSSGASRGASHRGMSRGVSHGHVSRGGGRTGGRGHR